MSPKHWRPATLAVRLAQGPVIGISLAVTAVTSVLFGIWLSLVGATTMHVFESQMAFSTQRFIDALGPLEPTGIAEVIRVTITLDFLYPVAYAIAIGGIWARLVGPTGWAGRAAPLGAALGAAAADWIENVLHLAAAAQMVEGTRPATTLVFAGSAFAAIKWGLLLFALLMTARAAIRRRGRSALTAIPIALLAGALAAAVLTAAV
jgi:hypothetical protein